MFPCIPFDVPLRLSFSVPGSGPSSNPASESIKRALRLCVRFVEPTTPVRLYVPPPGPQHSLLALDDSSRWSCCDFLNPPVSVASLKVGVLCVVLSPLCVCVGVITSPRTAHARVFRSLPRQPRPSRTRTTRRAQTPYARAASAAPWALASVARSALPRPGFVLSSAPPPCAVANPACMLCERAPCAHILRGEGATCLTV